MAALWIAQLYIWGVLFCGGLPGISGPELVNGQCGTIRTAGGRVFVLGFQEITFTADLPVYEIVVDGICPDTTVTLSMNEADFKKKINVGKGETVTVELPNTMENKGSGINSHGIIIKADADIIVKTPNFKKTSGDVALPDPVDQWGKEYYIIAPIDGPSKRFAQFGVLAPAIPTTVTILPSAAIQYNGKSYQKGDPMIVKLEPFRFMQIQSKDNLSGTMISTDHTVIVITGNLWDSSNGGIGDEDDY